MDVRDETAMKTATVRIVLADMSRLTRELIVRILNAAPGVDVRGLKRAGLTDAQARAVGRHENQAMPHRVHGGQQLLDRGFAVPGLTDTSLFPMAAEAAGIDFEELCDRVVTSAAERMVA